MSAQAVLENDVVAHFHAALAQAARHDVPFVHWLLQDCLPEKALKEIDALPFGAHDPAGISGKRELHNDSRIYFDPLNRERHAVVEHVSTAFQHPVITTALFQVTGRRLSGASLRIEFAQDMDGFWLEPHTDLGVKWLTLLIYVSADEGNEDMGTDLYDTDKVRVRRARFTPDAAMLFVPSDITYHGFEKRPITGVRKSLIVNYVSPEWRSREQLAFPDEPVA